MSDGVDPMLVIAALKARIGDDAVQVAAMSVRIDQLECVVTELRNAAGFPTVAGG